MNAPDQTLTSRQRAQLRRLAHHAKPSIHIGKGGVNDAILRAVEEAFTSAELVKIKVLEAAPASARDVAEEVSRGIDGVTVVQVMGRIATLYRRHPENPRINLEDRKGRTDRP